MKLFKYQNITISGLPGSGSTTLLALLKESLKFDGWTGYSGGEFMRKYAVEKGLYDDSKKIHHDASAYADEFDRQIDFGVREKLQEQNKWIIESWLSGFFAQGVEGVLKVLVVCSDDAVRIDRIVNRDEVNVEQAKHHIHQRYQKNYSKWIRLYNQQWQDWIIDARKAQSDEPIDFWKPEFYDVVIDTFSNNQQQTLDIVLDAIKK